MDSFDNFQYDSASSYGGIGVVDDTSSVYTADTQDNSSSVDLSSLSISELTSDSAVNHPHHSHNQPSANLDEDFDAVLDDLKDESAVDLPPHACRCVHANFILVPPTQILQLLWNPFSSVRRQMSCLLKMVLQLKRKHVCLAHRQSSRAR